jgi:hypothetical protein
MQRPIIYVMLCSRQAKGLGGIAYEISMCDLWAFARHVIRRAMLDYTGVCRSLDRHACVDLAPNRAKAQTFLLIALALLCTGCICFANEAAAVGAIAGIGYFVFLCLWWFFEWRGVHLRESCYSIKSPTVIRNLRYLIRRESRPFRRDQRSQRVFRDAWFFFWLAVPICAVSRVLQYQFTQGILQSYYPRIEDEAESMIGMLYLFSSVLFVVFLARLAYLTWVWRWLLYRFSCVLANRIRLPTHVTRLR